MTIIRNNVKYDNQTQQSSVVKHMDVIHTKNCIIKLIAVILISLMIHIGLQINKIIKSITASEYRFRKL